MHFFSIFIVIYSKRWKYYSGGRRRNYMNKKGALIAVLSIMLIASVSSALAGGHWGGRGGGRYGGGHWGGYYNSCRWGIGLSSPYFYGGYYYGYPNNYVVVETPVVRSTTVVTPASDPAPQQSQASVASAAPNAPQSAAQLEAVPRDSAALQAQPSIGDTATIYVPNSAGRFTPVKLVKRGNGYTGPQGEFYPHSPTIAQLKALYSY